MKNRFARILLIMIAVGCLVGGCKTTPRNSTPGTIPNANQSERPPGLTNDWDRVVQPGNDE
jgi:hypothetical protein